MREWMKRVVPLCTVLAAIGLALCIFSQVAALLGWKVPLGHYDLFLWVGWLVVCVPMVLITKHLTQDFESKDFWKAALRGCPPWMHYMAYGFMGYAFIGAICYLAVYSDLLGTSASTGRGVGHWNFVFLTGLYSEALSIFYSAGHVSDWGAGRQCLNGHPVAPLVQFCEQCGELVAKRPFDPGA